MVMEDKDFAPKIQSLLNELPEFVNEIYNYYEKRNVKLATIYQSLLKIKKYFNYLIEYTFKNEINIINEITIAHLNRLEEKDIKDYIIYIESRKNVNSNTVGKNNFAVDLGPIRKLIWILNLPDESPIKNNNPFLTMENPLLALNQSDILNNAFRIIDSIIPYQQLQDFIRYKPGEFETLALNLQFKFLRNRAFFALVCNGIKPKEALTLKISNLDNNNKKLSLVRDSGTYFLKPDEFIWGALEEYYKFLCKETKLTDETLLFFRRLNDKTKLVHRTLVTALNKASKDFFGKGISFQIILNSFALNLMEVDDLKMTDKLIALQMLNDHKDLTSTVKYLEIIQKM